MLKSEKKSKSNKFSPIFLESNIVNNISTDYDSYKTNIKSILNKWGFVIVNNILNKKDQKESENQLYKDLLESVDNEKIKNEEILKLVKDIKKSKKWPKSSTPGLISRGFLSYHGLPHGKFAWNLRTNEKCKKIYEFLHDEEDLVVGMDMPFFNPSNTENKKEDMWLMLIKI